MNGLELAQKALRWDPDRPVILTTAFAEVNNARESVKIGVYDFISKPFDLVDFGNSVARAIKHRRVVMENRAYQHNLEKMVAKRTRELREIMRGLDRKVKELKARDRINQHLLKVHTIDGTTSAIAEAVHAALGVERLALFLPEEQEGNIKHASSGPEMEN